MIETKWPLLNTMTSYMPLPYSYNNEYSHDNANHKSQPVLPISPNKVQSGLMSVSQPASPRPTLNAIHDKPPTRKKSPTKSLNYTTTTFHSNPYPGAGPIRRRRTESIFSFEMGPTFSPTKQHYDLTSMDQSNSYQIQLHAKMDRGFFKADQDWTCYRRNYFQVSATFDVHGMNYMLSNSEVPCLLRKPDTQELLQVDYFSIGISARVSSNEKRIELVQHTPKRDKGPQMIPEPRPVRAGGNLHLASVGSNNNLVTFERLQFKTATANNGKRRAAQQYYEIVVDLYANFSRGRPLCVATCVSAALVVRGRSPGHYADSHTRFKHMDTDTSLMNERSMPPVNMGSSIASNGSSHDDKFSHGARLDHHHRYPSLPNSPISEFGQYSPYNNYPYSSLSAYPSVVPPTSSNSNLSHYPNHSSSNNSTQGPPVSNPYFHNGPNPSSTQPVYDGYTPEKKNIQKYWSSNEPSYNNHLYMNHSDPYGRSHHEDENSYSSGLDAGRS